MNLNIYIFVSYKVDNLMAYCFTFLAFLYIFHISYLADYISDPEFFFWEQQYFKILSWHWEWQINIVWLPLTNLGSNWTCFYKLIIASGTNYSKSFLYSYSGVGVPLFKQTAPLNRNLPSFLFHRKLTVFS